MQSTFYFEISQSNRDYKFNFMFLKFRKQAADYILGEATMRLVALICKEKKWRFSIEDYRKMPEDTIGRVVAEKLDKMGHSFIYNGHQHDIRHIVLEYEMNVIGEIRMQYFLVGNDVLWDYKGWMTIVFGMLVLPDYWRTYLKEWKRGRAASKITHLEWENRLEENVNDVRTFYNILPHSAINLEKEGLSYANF